MKRCTVVFAMMLFAVTLLCSMSQAVSADELMLPAMTLMQIAPSTTPTDGDKPTVHGSWGGLKHRFDGRATTTTPNLTNDQSAVTSDRSMLKGGVGTYSGTAANQVTWRAMSQASRNEAICQKAYSHMTSLGGGINKLSRPSGYNCKTWVQSYVVPGASQGVAEIPTSASWCRWNSGRYVSIVGYGPAGVSINGADRGQIVQASWGNYPHTMIIWSRDANGVSVIDCNMDLRGGLEIHYISFSSFESISGGCYTVYQVIGG